MDVIEIDAASNRKVEDAQNILERVMYAPVNSRYKIYIIDEVHMLSDTAFNALLKTLEEPPKNVIFILATTEVHKVLDTIKSRCQRYDFRRITTDDIVKHLRMISDKEEINITDDALVMIAKNSAGGMRDSIALLEQLSVLGGEITPKEINELLGRISFEILEKLTGKIINSDPNGGIELLENIYNSGNEPIQIMINLLDYVRNLMLAKTCEKEIAIELSQLNDAQIDTLKKQSENIEVHQIISLINKISEYIKELKLTTNPKLWLEVAIIDLANLTQNTTLEKLQERISKLEGGITTQSTLVATKVSAPKQPIQEQKSTPIKKTETPAQTKAEKIVEEFSPMPEPQPVKASEADDISTLWGKILNSIPNMSVKALLHQMGNPIEISENGVTLAIKGEIFLKQFTEGSKRTTLEAGIKSAFGKEVPLTVRLARSEDKQVSPRLGTQGKSWQNSVTEKPNESKIEKTVPETTPNEQMPQPDVTDEEIIAAQIESDLGEPPSKSEEYFMHSDLVNNVLQVFDGKIIE